MAAQEIQAGNVAQVIAFVDVGVEGRRRWKVGESHAYAGSARGRCEQHEGIDGATRSIAYTVRDPVQPVPSHRVG